MNDETALLVGIGASLATSVGLWWWFRGTLREMLGQLCGRQPGTDFWARYTVLMLVIAPLAIVVFFTPLEFDSTVKVLRRILLAILLGHFFAFALVGRTLFSAVRRSIEREQISKATSAPRS